MLYPEIAHFIDQVNTTPEGPRKALWDTLTSQLNKKPEVRAFNFICTHNARRSVLSQCMATALFHQYNIEDYRFFSGGAETTFVHPNTIEALRTIGFRISKISDGENPVYEASFSENAAPLKLFSKTFDDPSSSQQYFAILVCSKGDAACPFIPDAAARVLIPFDDPGNFDGTPKAEEKYLEAASLIAGELHYFVQQLV